MSIRFTRLTRVNIRRLKPGAKITEHGITAERLPDGDTRYSINIMADGERIHRVIGRQSERVTRTQAEQFIAKARSGATEGRLGLPQGRKLHLTFDAAAGIYLKKLREGSGKNIREKEWHLRLHLTPYFRTMRLERISTFTLEKFRKRCQQRGLSNATTYQLFSTYRHMGRRLLEWGDIRLALPMIRLGSVENRRNFVLDDAGKARLLKAALADSNPYIWLFIMLGLHTSLRHSEILSARFEHLDAKRRRLRAKVKGGRWREQPLTRTISEILEREREMATDPEGWVFPNPKSASGHYESMKAPFRRAAVAASLDPRAVTPHTLRHTAITDLAETGAAVQTVREFSGHRTTEMVMRYIHAREHRVNEALDQLEARGTKGESVTHLRRPRS